MTMATIPERHYLFQQQVCQLSRYQHLPFNLYHVTDSMSTTIISTVFDPHQALEGSGIVALPV